MIFSRLMVIKLILLGISAGTLFAQMPSNPDIGSARTEMHLLWDQPTDVHLRQLDQWLSQPERYAGFHQEVRLRKLNLLLESGETGGAEIAAQEAQQFIAQTDSVEDRRTLRSCRVTALSGLGNWEEAIAEQHRLMNEYGDVPPRPERAQLADLLLQAAQPQKSLNLWESIGKEDGDSQNGTAESDVVMGMVQAYLALNRGEEALEYLNQNPPKQEGNEYLDQARSVMHLLVRSRVFESLGRTAEASADRNAAENIRSDLQNTRRSPTRNSHRNLGRNIRELSKWWLVIPGLVVWGIFLFTARQQRIQEGGTWIGYTGITLGMACLCLLPWIIVVSLAWWREQMTEDIVALSIVGIIVSVIYTTIFLKVPYLVVSGKAVSTFPELKDPETLTTVADISGRMRIRPPKVRHIPSTITLGGLQAQVSGLVASTVLIDLGVLHRLTYSERKAILAHELAHIRNHTIGVFACICPLAMSAAMIVFAEPDQFFLIMSWALAFGLGLRKFVSRRFEYDCDRRAAELCGAAELASALVKFHADSAIRNDGWASLLTFATQTHPSREQRLATLAERFPEATWTGGVWSHDRRRQQNRVNWLVGLAWLTILGVAAYFQSSEWSILGAAVCCLVWILPIVFLQRAIRPEVKRHLERQRIKTTGANRLLALSLILLFGLLVMLVWISDRRWGLRLHLDATWLFWGILPLGIMTIWALRRSRRSSAVTEMNQNIQSALVKQNWQLAASIADEEPEAVKADFAASHNTALAHWMLGHELEAIAELRRTWEQFPLQLQTGLTLWGLYCELEDWDSAIAIAEEFARRATADPLPRSLKASALARAGRMDEVRLLLSERWPEEERFSELTVLARVRMEENDLDSARKLIEEAGTIAPAVVRLRLLGAELELACGNLMQAGELLEAAEKQLIDAPLELVQKRLVRLQNQLMSIRQISQAVP